MGEVLTAKRSIRGKLDRLVVLSVGTALVLACALNVWQEGTRYLQSRQDALFATAQVFAAATSRAVAASDDALAMQSLRAIARTPGLLRAEVFGRGGDKVAELGLATRLGSDPDLDEGASSSPFELLWRRTVRVSVPVVESGEEVGRVVLLSDISDLPDRFWSALTVPLAGSAAALGLGLFLSRRLQGQITRPLLALTSAMSNVQKTGAYMPVTAMASDDETGVLAARFNAMIVELKRGTDAILAREDEIIERLSRAGEQRDDQTGQHVVRVARVSRVIAERLGLDPRWTDDLCRASPMHDVGKISVPDAILFKPGRLDPDERARMEEHAVAGHRVLAGSSAPLVQLAAEIALSHHERWDGKGYPNKLAGDAIPLSGRITAVADVCDALLSERPYKKPWTLDAVRTHLAENAGSHFDPACVEAALASWPAVASIYEGERTLAA